MKSRNDGLRESATKIDRDMGMGTANSRIRHQIPPPPEKTLWSLISSNVIGNIGTTMVNQCANRSCGKPLHSLRDAVPLVRWHHERLDGRGYPDNLDRSRIPIAVRIVTVADDGALHGRLTGPQGSAILTSMARANALLIVPEDRPRIEAGGVARAILLTEDATFSSRLAL